MFDKPLAAYCQIKFQFIYVTSSMQDCLLCGVWNQNNSYCYIDIPSRKPAAKPVDMIMFFLASSLACVEKKKKEKY